MFIEYLWSELLLKFWSQNTVRYMNSLEVVDDAVRRLEELNKWQEHQKKLLQERQNKQRQDFGMGKKKIYEMLGVTPLEDDLENKARIGDAPTPEIGESSDICNDGRKGVFFQKDANATGSPKPKLKKAFLRRGEGLKKRFKIDPNDLRLSNLPRYKYSKVHSSLSRNTKPHTTSKKITNNIENIEEKNKELDDQERRFQQLFVSSKNIFNSTPDMKTPNSNSTETKINLLRVNDKGRGVIKYSAKYDTISNNVINTNESISWAKVLDTQQIKPISVQQIRSVHSSFEIQDSDENLSIFELLEQKANEGTIDMNSSCVKNFMGRKIQEDQDEIPVQPRLKAAGILPSGVGFGSVILTDTDDNDDDEDDASDGGQAVSKELDLDCDSTLTSRQIRPKQAAQVRFADVNNTHEYTEASSDTSSAVTNISSSFDLFEQFKQALFAAINSNELSANDTKFSTDFKANQSVPKLISIEDLQDVINLVKTRLSQLEKEIDTFKENNISLIKAKQQHEFEKTVFMQEQREALDKLNDERIQLEIYLHDERMKLEDEKRAFQRQMHMQKSSLSSKERKEITKLKEELEEMAKQLKQKDQAHIAAQARLRAQIRNLEKDQRQLNDDIERLEKENKHLQNENLRISRETNNKMLQEINRNIEKLAPKLSFKNSNGNSSDYFKDNTEVKKHKKSKIKSKSTLNKNTLMKTTKIHQMASTSSSDSEENTNVAKISKQSSFDVENVPLSKLQNTEKGNAPHSVTERSEETLNLNDFKREIVNPDGSKDIWYSNGNLKKISPDGMLVRMLYFNKDIKETNINEGTVKYYYAETNTWHTSYLDGLEIFEFPNGQTEHRYKNGVVEVHFPNNSVKISNPAAEDIAEEWRFADGTNLKEMRNGDKILTLPNGQKEIHTKLNKRREYPDGTVKFVYPDGSQETRYSNGRVRLKDKNGQLIMDSENPV